MKTSFLYFVLFLLSPMPDDQDKAAADIVVQVSGLQSGEGTVSVALFQSAEDFTDNPFKTLRQPLEQNQTEVELRFEDIEAGTYAIAVYQDLDENEELNTNFVGIPQEPYGFSNNYRPTMSSPSFDKAKFTLSDSEVVQQIKVE